MKLKQYIHCIFVTRTLAENVFWFEGAFYSMRLVNSNRVTPNSQLRGVEKTPIPQSKRILCTRVIHSSWDQVHKKVRISKIQTGLKVRFRSFSGVWRFDRVFGPVWKFDIKHSDRTKTSIEFSDQSECLSKQSLLLYGLEPTSTWRFIYFFNDVSLMIYHNKIQRHRSL